MKKRKIYQQANPSGNESSGFFEVNEEQVLYNLKDSSMLPILTEQFISFLEEDGRVKQAWLFGSVLSDSFHKTSDIDLMVEFNSENEYSMFDILDIAHKLGQTVGRKVDIVEKGFLEDFAIQNAVFMKIYE